MYTRSAIEAMDTSALEDAAAHWSRVAGRWDESHAKLITAVSYPGGGEWEGEAAEAALAHVHRLRAGAMLAIDALYAGAATAREGADELAWCREQVTAAVTAATDEGFTVGEDFSVSDSTRVAPAMLAARQVAAQAHAVAIRSAVVTLADTDEAVAGDLTSKTGDIQMMDGPLNAVDENGQPVDTSSGKLPPAPPGKEWHYYVGWGYRLEDPLEDCSGGHQFWDVAGIGGIIAGLPFGGAVGAVGGIPALGGLINDLDHCKPPGG